MATSMARLVGRRVRQLRTARIGPPLTQAALAEEAGISVSYLSLIERGLRSPQLETLDQIARVLGVSTGELLSSQPPADKLEPLYRPLIEYCRRQSLTRRDVDRLLAVAKGMFS